MEQHMRSREREREREMRREACEARLNRGPWSAREDLLLISYIQAHGEGQWRSLPNRAGLLRCGKSCRLRWLNYLRPGIKRGNITSEEEDLIIRLQSLLGNRWSLIAGRLPGRTDNEIKNHWNTHILKRLKQEGIHPKPHNHFSRKRKPKIIKNNDVGNQVLYLPKPRRVSAARFTRSSDDSCRLGSVGSSNQLQEQEQPRPRAAEEVEVDDVSGDNNNTNNNIPWDSFDYDLSLQDYTILNEVYNDFLQLL